MGRKGRLPFYDLPAPNRPDGTPLYAAPYHWPAYEWLRILQAAGVGDYGRARASVRAIRSGLQAEQEGLKRQLKRLQERVRALVPWLIGARLPYVPRLSH